MFARFTLLFVFLTGIALADGVEKTALHFQRITAGTAEDGFEAHCGKPSGQCQIVQLLKGKPQESTQVSETELRQWLAKFAAATKGVAAKRGTPVIEVSYLVDGKTVRVELSGEEAQKAKSAVAAAFVALESQLREAVASNP